MIEEEGGTCYFLRSRCNEYLFRQKITDVLNGLVHKQGGGGGGGGGMGGVGG